MKKGTIGAGIGALLAMVFGPLTVVEASTAGATVMHRADQTEAITIDSWLYAVPSENVLSATVWDCFRITGAINDQGGGPTWASDAAYHVPNTMSSGGTTAASQECSKQSPRRRVPARAPARGRPVPVRYLYGVSRLARGAEHSLCHPHPDRTKG